MQLSRDVEHDCWLADAWVRLDTLETSYISLQRNEMLNSVIAQLDAMHDVLEEVLLGVGLDLVAEHHAEHLDRDLALAEARDGQVLAGSLVAVVVLLDDASSRNATVSPI